LDSGDYDHSLPIPKLLFATTMPPIVPLTDDEYSLQELYEAEEQFGTVLLASFHCIQFRIFPFSIVVC